MERHAGRVQGTLSGAVAGALAPAAALAARGASGGAEAVAALLTDPVGATLALVPVVVAALGFAAGWARDRAEAQARERERALVEESAARGRALERLRAVVDHTGEALVVIDADGRLDGEPQRLAASWFGAPSDTAAAWLFGPDEDAARTFDLLLRQIRDGALPFDVLADQLPRRVERGGRAWALRYRRLDDGAGLLAVVREVTAEEAARRAEAEHRALQGALAAAVADPAAFARTVADLRLLVARATGAHAPLERARALRALQDAAALAGFVGVARAAHDVEDELTAGRSWSERLAWTLRAAWSRADEAVQQFPHRSGRSPSPAGSPPRTGSGDTGPRLRAMVAASRRPRLEPLLRRLAAHAEQAAHGSGRAVDVVVDCDPEARVADDQLEGLWSGLVEVVRNAVRHGVEPPDTRADAGKVPTGTVRIEAWASRTQTWITIRDDGCGVDWDGVRARGRAAGLRAATDDDLRRILFSARPGAAGLPEVRRQCAAIGVSVELASVPGRGTVVSFGVPTGAPHVADLDPSGPMPADATAG